MLKALMLLICVTALHPTLVLAKSIGFLSFDDWKNDKIKSAIAAQQIMEQLYANQNKTKAEKVVQKAKFNGSQKITLGDVQSSQLAAQTAKHLKLDDYLAVYWAPRADSVPIEKVASGLSPAQVKELLTAYVQLVGLDKSQLNQSFKMNRMGSK